MIQERIVDCRAGCGACCIAPSISSPIPGMPLGKPAGVRCVQLLDDYRCAIFGKPERPAVCVGLRPSEAMCGANREEAMAGLRALEIATAPGSAPGSGPG
ncbi:MAG: YkgJ family cysteine cluster protein [Verrucomicrobia bacterium]|nr:YkgJ family cysteine cluster protein [Verrucomicrobiota bacterium]